MPKIGMANRVGGIGKAAKKIGPIGKTKTTFGCLSSRTLVTQLSSLDYPTTTV